jgi:hypothetical protein
MNYETEINNLFGLFINEDSYFPMFQRIGFNISQVNPSFKNSFENGVLFHPNEINPRPSESEQETNKELRIELVNLIRTYLKQYDQTTYGEIYKLFQSVDHMRDTIRNLEGSTQQLQLEVLIGEVERRVDQFTKTYLFLPKESK